MFLTTLLLLVIFFVFAAINGLLGFARGIVKQSIRAVMMLISFICAIYFAKLLTDAVMVWMDHKTAADILAIVNKLNIPTWPLIGALIEPVWPFITAIIGAIDPSTLNYVLAIPLSLFVSPIAFPFFFITFQLLMLIPYFIICGSIGIAKRAGRRGKDKKKKKRRAYSWATGIALGVVQGVIMLALIISPIAGILSCSTEVVDKMEEEAPDMPTTVTISNSYNSWVKPWAESPVIKAVAGLGGSKLYHSLSTVKIDGEKYDMFETLSDPSIKVAITIHELRDFDWTSPTAEQEDAIRGIIDVLDDHEYATQPIVDVIQVINTIYKSTDKKCDICGVDMPCEHTDDNGDNVCDTCSAAITAPSCEHADENADGVCDKCESVMPCDHIDRNSVISIKAEGDLGEIIDSVFGILDSIKTPTDLKNDIATLADVYFLLAENGTLSALKEDNEDAVIDSLTGTIEVNGNTTTVITEAIRILNSNEHTEPLVTSITKLTISSLITSVLPEGTEKIYDNIKEGAGDILSIEKVEGKEEEYIEEVSGKLDTVLKDNGIEVEKEILDEMAGYVSDNYDKLYQADGEISDADVNEIILSYYDAYIKFQQTQNQNPCEHADENGDNKCDKCGADFIPAPTCEHTDDNGDNKCDKCGADVASAPDVTE